MNTSESNSADEQQAILDGFKDHFNSMIEDMIGGPNFLQGISKEYDEYANGLHFKNVYYGGGTLFFDTNKSIIIGLNISNSRLILQKLGGNGDYKEFLMPMKLLWMAFHIYLTTKGKNAYYMTCYYGSEIRHLYDIDMEKHQTETSFEPVLTPPLFEMSLN